MNNIVYTIAQLMATDQPRSYRLKFGGEEIPIEQSFEDALEGIPNFLQEHGWETYSITLIGKTVVFHVKKPTILLPNHMNFHG